MSRVSKFIGSYLCLSFQFVITSIHVVNSEKSVKSPENRDGQKLLLSRIKGVYFGALVADALTLGSHYEYDSENVWGNYGGAGKNLLVNRYYAPGEKTQGATHGIGWGRRNYHPGQKRGDTTDYGEYNRLALDYLSQFETDEGESGSKKTKPISKIADLIKLWRSRMEETNPQSPLYWGAWKCTQTRQALQKIAIRPATETITESTFKQLGGHSNAIALRSAPVFGVYETEQDVARASDRLMFTHASYEAKSGGEFFTRLAYRILYQIGESTIPSTTSLISIMQSVAEDMKSDIKSGGYMSSFISDQVKKGVDKFKEAVDPKSPLFKKSVQDFNKLGGHSWMKVDDLAVTSMARLWDVGKSEPIKVGKASPTEGVMPSSIYFILKYLYVKYESLKDDSDSGFAQFFKNSDFLTNETAFSLASKGNVMVGGDNASRSICIGMILGAIEGENGIPEDLKSNLNGYQKEQEKLNKLSVVKKLQDVVGETGRTEL